MELDVLVGKDSPGFRTMEFDVPGLLMAILGLATFIILVGFRGST